MGRIAAAAAVLLALSTALASGAKPHPASARAQAFARQDPSGARHDFVSVDGDGDTSGDETRGTAATRTGKARATAAVATEKVNVFDGLVTADEVRARAEGTDDGTSTSGSVVGLAIEGRPETAPDDRTVYDLDGYGKMVALDSGPTGVLGL